MSAPALPIIRQRGRWLEELPSHPLRWLLAPLWPLAAGAVAMRSTAYDRGWLAVRRAGMPVISVGNLVAGGAGKTPVAITIAARLRALGRQPAILARGYRAGADGRNEEAHLAGNVPVICDPDRVRGAARARAEGADCAVLDDGFQHRRLHRDLDVVVLDATRPFGADDGGDGALLPLGLRREGLAALSRAQLLWLTRAELAGPAAVERLLARLRRLALPVVRDRLLAVEVDRPAPGPWLLVSGIGHPRGFELAAQRTGAILAESWRFPDHHRYGAADAAAIAARARHLGASVVATAKDAVKLAPLLPELRVLTMRTALAPEDQTVLDRLLAQAVASG